MSGSSERLLIGLKLGWVCVSSFSVSMQRACCIISTGLAKCWTLFKWFSRPVPPPLTKHQCAATSQQRCHYLPLQEDGQLRGSSVQLFSEMRWLYLSLRAKSWIIHVSLLSLSFSCIESIMVVNWNITYPCKIYEENLVNTWIFQESCIDENTELNWLKLFCTVCYLTVGN